MRLKRDLEGGLKEALKLGHNYIGTEHLLLGLVREPEGTAQQILAALGVTPEAVRDEVMRQLGSYRTDGPVERPEPAVAPGATGAPRVFALDRQQDVTGVSGSGVVAHGVQFADGTVVLRWLGEYASTVIWESLEAAMHVHGHDGRTTVVWQ